GKSGKATVNVDLNYGVQNWDKIQAAGAQEYIEIINTRRANDGTAPLFNPDDFGAGTDWWDEVVVDYAPVTNANVRASGGSDNIKYSGSLSFFDQQSNYDKGWYQRVT
ncbi:SusC/RagA family TonB-linked outer membrane protein, partial [Oceanospirillum sp. D5]|nr:SusC/RagA family TonB-linked outer membrane protein [Oceanospirillum sediminis]